MESEGNEASHLCAKRNKPTNHSQFPSSSMQDLSLKICILPTELITEILLRLPVKSLLKFRCVSKSWLALISSPQFVNTHLSICANNKDNTHQRLIVTVNRHKYNLKDISVSSLLYDSVTEALDLDYPTRNTHKCISIVGSINGLICLSVGEANFFIWNPLVRKFKELSDCRDAFCFGYPCIYGFGYDERHDDYKVVVGLANKRYDRSFLVKVKMYSLTSDSWTSIEDFRSDWFAIRSAMFVNGKLHWTICTYCHPCDSWDIISIDLADRKWGKVEQPSYEEGDIYSTLGVLGTDLSVCYNYLGIRADVWVMKEYGVKKSWIKMFTICHPFEPLAFEFYTFFCMSNKGKVLFVCGPNVRIYNPKDDSILCSKITSYNTFYEANIYIESLVWPFIRKEPMMHMEEIEKAQMKTIL
ncbi:F-box/kelch-repeat protein At3g23880-like isoform X1 [Lycium barbarum]|uniref:F-box/kelch-repeat protein At3g23880-like isoform X1 n=1 Tax=Lycium barbarum TaxID=112863 RepID=UPI00293E5BBF|nr:F-box/kelch-repeat protein At3g23880-like isoform X1 [Lycium barbarum]